MNIDFLSTIEVFLAIAKEKSFKNAAIFLNMSPSSVTKELVKLEAELGCELFFRTTRKVSLSEQGEKFYTHAIELKAMADYSSQLFKQFNNPLKGPIKISAPIVFGRELVAPVIIDLQKKYPELEIELHFSDRQVDLINENFDLAIRTSSTLPSSSFFVKNIGPIRRAICCSKSFSKLLKTDRSNQNTIDPKDYLCYKRNGSVLKINGDFKGRKIQITPDSNFKCNSVYILKDAALKGIGIADLPYYMVEKEIKNGKLIHLYKGIKRNYHSINLLYKKRLQESTKLSLIVEALSNELKRN